MHYIKKANGQLVEAKPELGIPDLVVDAPDTEAMLHNAASVTVRMLAGLQNATRKAGYVPDSKDTKMLKELVEITLTIDGHRQKNQQADKYSRLSEEELRAMVGRWFPKP